MGHFGCFLDIPKELLEVMHQEANANGPAGGKRGQLDQQLRRMNMAGLSPGEVPFISTEHSKRTVDESDKSIWDSLALGLHVCTCQHLVNLSNPI